MAKREGSKHHYGSPPSRAYDSQTNYQSPVAYGYHTVLSISRVNCRRRVYKHKTFQPMDMDLLLQEHLLLQFLKQQQHWPQAKNTGAASSSRLFSLKILYFQDITVEATRGEQSPFQAYHAPRLCL